MHRSHHSTVREGLLTGLLGALIVAAWYFFVDLGRGQMFYTPNVLGQVFVAADTTPTVRQIAPLAVAQYTVLHFAIFCLLGLALVKLTHLAGRNPSLRMGVWLGLVIAFLFFLGYLLVLYNITDERFPWWSALIGDLLGVGSMGLLLWRRHPQLRASVGAVPLGSEVRPPPHPPGAPRA